MLYFKLSYKTYPEIWVRKNDQTISIGMTHFHKSCLVLLLQGSICYIQGISTKSKSGFLKDPLGIEISKNIAVSETKVGHLKTWLDIACATARFFGAQTVRLFDAANLYLADGTCVFFSRCTLLRNKTFLYTKYGFVPCNVNRTDYLNVLQKATALNINVDTILQQENGNYAYAELDHIFQDIATVEEMQFWYTKHVGYEIVHLEQQIIVPRWLRKYSERWLDVY